MFLVCLPGLVLSTHRVTAQQRFNKLRQQFSSDSRGQQRSKVGNDLHELLRNVCPQIIDGMGHRLSRNIPIPKVNMNGNMVPDKSENVRVAWENLEFINCFYTNANDIASQNGWNADVAAELAEGVCYGNEDLKKVGLYNHPTGQPFVRGSVSTRYFMEQEDTAVCMMKLIRKKCDPVGLNLANARQAGGGYLKGCNAQEESLCRSGPFYWLQMWLRCNYSRRGVSVQKPVYYKGDRLHLRVKKTEQWGDHSKQSEILVGSSDGDELNVGCHFGTLAHEFMKSDKNLWYDMEKKVKYVMGPRDNEFRTERGNSRNGCSYIPYSPQMREFSYQNDKGKYEISDPQGDRFFKPLSFIQKAAENFSLRHNNGARGGQGAFIKWWENKQCDGRMDYIRRFRAIAYAAMIQGHDTVVLGAFGCGAFDNEPTRVAKAMNLVFRHEFRDVFKNIVHCQLIFTPKDQTAWDAFDKHFIKSAAPSQSTSPQPRPSSVQPAPQPVQAIHGDYTLKPQEKLEYFPKAVCKCGHPVCPDKRPGGKAYDTCCMRCTKTNGTDHSDECWQRYQMFKCKCCDRLINYSSLTDSGKKGDTCCRPCARATFGWLKVHDDECSKRNGYTPGVWDKYKKWIVGTGGLTTVAGTGVLAQKSIKKIFKKSDGKNSSFFLGSKRDSGWELGSKIAAGVGVVTVLGMGAWYYFKGSPCNHDRESENSSDEADSKPRSVYRDTKKKKSNGDSDSTVIVVVMVAVLVAVALTGFLLYCLCCGEDYPEFDDDELPHDVP